ncbi:MAG: hypothetical protein ACI4HN_08805 [Ruminococcus sp.]
MLEKLRVEKNVRILGVVISVLLLIRSLGFVGNILYEIYLLLQYMYELVHIIYSMVDIVSQGMLLTAFVLLAVTILNKNKLNIDIIKIFAELFLIANILYLTNGLYQLVVVFGADILSILGAVFSKPLFYLFAVSKIAIATAILVFNKMNKLVPENKSAKLILSILFAVSFCLYFIFEIGTLGIDISFITFILSDDSGNINSVFSNGIYISFFVNIIFLLAEYIPLFLFFVIYPKEYLDKKAVSTYSDNAQSE